MTEINTQKLGHPPWLKAMQNGAIGEARARAFLLNRFWVLERSVDIEGADFIIQRRITGLNILDRNAPRLGVVQVKYFGTPTTSHFVHKAYVLDERGEPRSEFFLLCFKGSEENPQSFIVTGKDLSENFDETKKNGNSGYKITYSIITQTKHFEIINPKRTLDRMEEFLELATFSQNRRFLSWALPSVKNDLAAILPEYVEPIDNWWGDIAAGFEGLKKKVQTALFDVEEIHDLLQQFASEIDPLKAEKIMEDIEYNCSGGYGWNISLPSDMYDEEFFNVCRRHHEIVIRLTEEGLLDAYLNLKEEIKSQILNSIEPSIPVDRAKAFCYKIKYNTDSLKLDHFTHEETSEDLLPSIIGEYPPHSFEGMNRYSNGQLEFWWLPGAYMNRAHGEETTIGWYRSRNFRLYFTIMEAVFSLKYEDNYEPW